MIGLVRRDSNLAVRCIISKVQLPQYPPYPGFGQERTVTVNDRFIVCESFSVMSFIKLEQKNCLEVMGAAASIKQIYTDGITWFKKVGVWDRGQSD